MNDGINMSKRPNWKSWSLRGLFALMAVLVAVQFARFALHRTKERSWQVKPPLNQRMAARLPKLDNPISATEVNSLSQQLPNCISSRQVYLWGLLNNPSIRESWKDIANEEDREQLEILIDEFESVAFQKQYRDVCDKVARGWDCVQLGFTGTIVVLDRQWLDVMLAHARYCLEIKDDVKAAQKDYELLLKVRDLYLNAGTRMYSYHGNDISEEISRQLLIVATREKSLSGWKTFANDALAQNPIKSHNELLAGDIIAVETYFDTIFVPEEGWLDITRAINPNFAGSYNGSRWWNVLSPVFADLAQAEQAFNKFLAQMNNRETVRTLGAYRDLRLDKDTQWSALTMANWNNEWFMIYPYIRYLRQATEFEGMLAVLALGSFHHEHGTFPNALTELIPDFLPRVPIDYYADEPMRYRRTEDAYVLYSVGQDGQDNNAGPCTGALRLSGGCDLIFGFERRE